MNDKYIKIKEERERRRKNNLCISCGLIPPREDRRMCVDCSDKRLKYEAELRLRNTKEKREKRNAKNRELRRKYIERGLCPNCYKRPLEEGKKACSKCLKCARDRAKDPLRLPRGGMSLFMGEYKALTQEQFHSFYQVVEHKGSTANFESYLSELESKVYRARIDGTSMEAIAKDIGYTRQGVAYIERNIAKKFVEKVGKIKLSELRSRK